MDLHLENEGNFVDRRSLRKQELKLGDWMGNPHVQNIIAKAPRIAESLTRALTSDVLKDAIARASQYTNDELALRLTEDLEEGFPGLVGGAPQTVKDLDAREAMKKDPASTQRTMEEIRATNLEQRTGGSSDYLAQRMVTVSGLLDFGDTITHFSGLEASLRREADRVATLLVAFERADRELKNPDRLAAAK